MSSNRSRIGYLPGLNGLRFIAALVVMISHLEAMKPTFGMESNFWLPIPGKLGVVLFFALSGFLITCLLFAEREETQTVSLKSFYKRRVIRIWPLYHLVTISSIIFLIPLSNLFETSHTMPKFSGVDLALILALLPNLANVNFPYSEQNWSIGIEEQFYLFQPLAVKWFSSVMIFVTFVLMIFSSEIFNILSIQWTLCRGNSCRYLHRISEQLPYFGCIAIGCLTYFSYFRFKELTEKILFSRTTQVLSGALLFYFLYTVYIEQSEKLIESRSYAAIFSIFILNVSYNHNSLVKLENQYLRFLGEISYGLYMLHPICFAFTIFLVKAIVPSGHETLSNILIYIFGFLTVVGISKLSYVYFEGFFKRFR